ncbi:MAG TPA: alanine dehydrogenase, partial [Burkholderiales bacterium]
KGWKKALEEDESLRHGLNAALGRITHPAIAAALQLPCASAEAFL